MKRLSAALVILAATTAVASAQVRMSTTSMTCGQARGIVAQHGVAVLGTGGATFQRFVSDSRFCQRLETAVPTFAPTADSPQCLVGNVCVEAELPETSG